MKHSNMLKAGVFLGALLFVALHAMAADPDTLYVRYVEGGVELAEAGSSQWMDAVVNTPLIEGDTIRTATTGRAELFMKDGSVVRVGKGSAMRIIAVEQNGVQFKLDRGTAYINAKGSKEVPLYFDTYSAAMDITIPAVLRIDAYDNGISEVSVLSGAVYVTQQKGKMPVRSGERIVLQADGSAPVLTGLRGIDEWQRWNTDRDRAMLAGYGAGESYTYLPEELRTYSSDLDVNGQWVYTEEYDYVWVPTVITVSTWSPYRVGRWAWIRGSYVWIGYEPWGWAPYHYGRWVNHRHAGWCWVPPARGHVRWEPAHVAWVHSSKHIGWVPLAPGETYDRRRAPVINQTNVYNVYNNVTIEKSMSTARTAYKNAAAFNSMVTMDRNQLLRQRAVNVNVTKTAAAGLRKVNLPSGVVPARVKGGTQPKTVEKPRTPGSRPPLKQTAIDRTGKNATTRKTGATAVQKNVDKRPALRRSNTGSVPGVNAAGGNSARTGTAAGPERRISIVPGNTATVKGKRIPVGTQTPKTAAPLKDRIDSARQTGIGAKQQNIQVRSVPAPVNRRVDVNKGQDRKVLQPTSRAQSTVRVEEKRVPKAPNTNSGAVVGKTRPQEVKIRQRTPVVTPRPVQGNVPSNKAVVRTAPARSATIPVRPQTVTRQPAVKTQSPPAQAVRTPRQPVQAPQRIEKKPVQVRRENPPAVKAVPVKREAPKGKANTAVSSPAPRIQKAPVKPGNKRGNGGNSRPPETNRPGKP